MTGRCIPVSPLPLAKMSNSKKQKLFSASVWFLRIIVGAVFISSGFTKLDDLWGFVFKINEYLAAWDVNITNRAAVIIAAFSIAAYEFTCGVMLALGVMRRMVARMLLILMAFMLPLSLYIAIADPVADCGCFGDALVISNTATFIKNTVITAAVVFLVLFNTKASHPFLPVMQWAVVVSSLVYCTVIAIVGYSVQPLIDFRPYPVGEPLISYDDLRKDLTFYRGDEDITDSLMGASDSILLLLVSDPERHGMARSAQANAFSRLAAGQNTQMAAILATDDSTADRWAQQVAAEYPVYTAEDTQLKEVVRGDAALVYVTRDTVRWKRNIYSLSSDEPLPGTALSDYSPIEKSNILLWLTLIYATALTVIFAMRFTTSKKF